MPVLPLFAEFSFTLFVLVFALLGAADARFPETVNGRQHTLGLSIIAAPSANSQFNAPGNLPIAIDVSGNGKASGSSKLSLLELYLVSATLSANISVSSGTGLIQGEDGSTVKHVDFVLPECLPAGPYNLTLYDTGVFADQAYFTITSIPLTLVSNTEAGASNAFSCVSGGVAKPTAQPQADSPLPSAPFGPNGGAGKTESAAKEAPTTATDTTAAADDNDAPTRTLTFNPQQTQQGMESTSNFGAPTPGTNDDGENEGQDEDADGEDLPVGSDDDVQGGAMINPQLPVPIPEQVITIRGGYIVPVLASAASTIEARLSVALCILAPMFFVQVL